MNPHSRALHCNFVESVYALSQLACMLVAIGCYNAMHVWFQLNNFVMKSRGHHECSLLVDDYVPVLYVVGSKDCPNGPIPQGTCTCK